MPALPKFNTNTPTVRAFLFDVAEYWIKFGIDGWRLDVAADIDDDSFWQEFRRRVRAVNPEAYIVAEIWHEAQRWLQGDQFDATMNYLVTAAALPFFSGKHLDMRIVNQAGGYQGRVRSEMSANDFADEIDRLLHLYKPEITYSQLNLLDSHDTPRFLSCARGDQPSLKLAWLFMLTFPGAPCIYYGDEIGVDGEHDPDCRKSFPWDESQWDHSLLDYLKSAISLRKTHPSLRRGTFTRLWSADGVYAFGRALEGESLLVALNASEEPRQIEVQYEAKKKPKVLFGQPSDIEFERRQGQVHHPRAQWSCGGLARPRRLHQLWQHFPRFSLQEKICFLCERRWYEIHFDDDRSFVVSGKRQCRGGLDQSRRADGEENLTGARGLHCRFQFEPRKGFAKPDHIWPEHSLAPRATRDISILLPGIGKHATLRATDAL